MAVQQEDKLQELADQIDETLASVKELPEEFRSKALKLKKAIESFHEYALRKLVQTLRQTDAGKELLYEAVEDPAVYAMLLMHGIIKQDLVTRVAAVLEEVRPYLRSHGGDVELVKVEDQTVHVRLQGACSGCSLSAVTLKNGVEEAIKARIPEIEYVVMVNDQISSGYMPLDSYNISKGNLEEHGWVKGPSVFELMDDEKPRNFSTDKGDVLLVLIDTKVMAYRNQCPHTGKPLHEGEFDGTNLTSPWNGFQYDLTNGECITVPHVQLEPFPVRVEDKHVWIRIV